MNTLLYVYPGLVTAGVLVLYLATTIRVGRARHRFHLPPPRMDGPEEFQRIFRVQQNTLEQLALFLPTLWLFAFFVNPVWASWMGLVWLVGRTLYMIGYSQAAEKRAAGFIVAMLTTVIMLIWSVVGMVNVLLVMQQINSGSL